MAIKNRLPRCKLDGYFIHTEKISAHYLLRCDQDTEHGENKKKITAVPPAWFFWRDYRLVVGNLSIVPPLEPCCLPYCNFRFFCSVIVTIKVLKYLRKVFQRARMI